VNTKEAFQLLTLASARDGRTVDVEVATVWAKDLEDVSLVDAVEATQTHYRQSDKWLMPSHVLDGVRIIRDRRARAARVRPVLARNELCGQGHPPLGMTGTKCLYGHEIAGGTPKELSA